MTTPITRTSTSSQSTTESQQILATTSTDRKISSLVFKNGQLREMREGVISHLTTEDLSKKAQSGDTEAQYELGFHMLILSDLHRVDKAEAYDWLRKAAAQGHLDAKELI